MKHLLRGYAIFSRRVSLFFCLILAVLIFPSVCFSDENPYAAELKKAASEKKLAQSRTWEVLLHYKPVRGGVESLVDDPFFFLALGGKRNPEVELNATIDALFDASTDEKTNPRCRFVARHEWLIKELSIDVSKLPAINCAMFNEAMRNINPKSAALVFSAAHINAPASMFGHTFLRIDSDKESKLVSFAANYAALPTDTNGLIYAFKGVFGYYQGFYSILPYYTKVQEYNDMDQRDMWEYKLDLTEAEVRMMVYHLWEMKDLYTYYYFFDENCSYTIMFAMEAARPELRLTDGFGFSVIPVDTLRKIRDSGIIKEVEYRPSRSSKIRHVASLVGRSGSKTAIAVAKKEIEPESVLSSGIPATEKIEILDLAAEYSQYRYTKEKMEKGEFQRRFLAILKARGTIAEKSENVYSVPTPAGPEAGHRSKSFSLGIGTDSGRFYEEIRLRPAYHNLLDPKEGFIDGSQIEFFSLGARHYPERNNGELEYFDFLNILSLTPRDIFFKPLSWKVRTGFVQRIFPDKDDHLVYRTSAGAGYVAGFGALRPYVTVDGMFDISGRLEDSYALGGGATLGFLLSPAGRYSAHLYVRATSFAFGDTHKTYEAALLQSVKLSQNNSLMLEVKRERTFGIYSTDAALTWRYFFDFI